MRSIRDAIFLGALQKYTHMRSTSTHHHGVPGGRNMQKDEHRDDRIELSKPHCALAIYL